MLGILCGLADEEKIARRITGASVVCSGAVPQKARHLAQQLVDQGATRLMSFGVAGALNTELAVGDVVIGRKVISATGTWECDEIWGNELIQKIPTSQAGNIWGSETLVPTAAEKIGLHLKHRCAVVDMESQCAAEVAAKAGLPLAVVRVVCDEAEHNVPPLVMEAINADGSTNYSAALKGVLTSPLQLFDLLQVGRSMAKAMRVLRGTVGGIQDSGFGIRKANVPNPES